MLNRVVDRVRIAARHSDLARLQAQSVGRALQAAHPGLVVEYAFRASLGDANLQDPLWKMPEKGVFTEDFVGDLVDGRADFVVHSWKDLPTERRARTEVAATLPRADGRDLLLVRRDRIEGARASGRLKILTSSPRRAYNLDSFLQTALPFAVRAIEFANVRGNVPTRVRKLFAAGSAGDADGLIVAKAAFDRLLETEEWDEDGNGAGAEYAEVRAELRARLAECRWMALPLSANPGAAAQGALAIEIRRDRDDLRALLAPIACAATFAAVESERAILASHGGGCHQKIGVSRLSRPFGAVTFLRGLTDAGVTLREASLARKSIVPRATSAAALYPEADEPGADGKAGSGLFEREPLPESAWRSGLESASAFWIARANALPAGYVPRPDQIVWCAGLKSWTKLAARGVWVNGCADGLGEAEPALVDRLAGAPVAWTKLSHAQAAESEPGAPGACIGTYQLVPRRAGDSRSPDFRAKTHFFWMSGTAFHEALRIDPGLRARGHHACGPGKTAAVVARALGCDPAGAPGRFAICLGIEAWRAEALGAGPTSLNRFCE